MGARVQTHLRWRGSARLGNSRSEGPEHSLFELRFKIVPNKNWCQRKRLIGPCFHLVVPSLRQQGIFCDHLAILGKLIFESPTHTSHSLRGVDYREMILDRKSTRLNSSHVAISYAVF